MSPIDDDCRPPPSEEEERLMQTVRQLPLKKKRWLFELLGQTFIVDRGPREDSKLPRDEKPEGEEPE
jgi:hypothetical protein